MPRRLRKKKGFFARTGRKLESGAPIVSGVGGAVLGNVIAPGIGGFIGGAAGLTAGAFFASDELIRRDKLAEKNQFKEQQAFIRSQNKKKFKKRKIRSFN